MGARLQENLAICRALTPMAQDETKELKKSLEQSHAFLAYPHADYVT